MEWLKTKIGAIMFALEYIPWDDEEFLTSQSNKRDCSDTTMGINLDSEKQETKVRAVLSNPLSYQA